MADGVHIPDFLPETYFLQPLTAFGVFVDRFGAIRRQFAVDITGTATDDGFILDEAFLYDDGDNLDDDPLDPSILILTNPWEFEDDDF